MVENRCLYCKTPIATGYFCPEIVEREVTIVKKVRQPIAIRKIFNEKTAKIEYFFKTRKFNKVISKKKEIVSCEEEYARVLKFRKSLFDEKSKDNAIQPIKRKTKPKTDSFLDLYYKLKGVKNEA